MAIKKIDRHATFLLAELRGNQIVGTSQTDTLAIADTGPLTWSSSSYSSMSGIDVLDFSAHLTGKLTVNLTSSMMTQTDRGILTVVSGAGGIDVLRAGASVGGTVVVAGTGNVWLDNTTNNILTVQGDAGLWVHGGLGNDTIRAGTTGALLDGGAGNDKLFAGNAADTIMFATGYRSDTIFNFDVADDAITLTGVDFTTVAEALARISDTSTGAVLDLGNGDKLTFAGLTKGDLSGAHFNGLATGPVTHHIGSDVTAEALNALLASAGDGATFILSEGLHVFDQQILITHDNVTFRGESEAGTILRFAFAAGLEADGIHVKAGPESLVGAVTGDIAAHQTAITLADTSRLKAGDTLRIEQANDAAYMEANGWTNVSAADAAKYPFRVAEVQIDRIVGNTVYLTHEIPYAMAAGLAQVYLTDFVHGTTLADFTIDSGLGAANANDFANLLPAYDGIAAIRTDGTIGANLAHITLLNSASLGFDLRGNIDMTGRDLTVVGAWNKGSDGNGYGLQIGDTFNSTFTGLDITDTRHAVLFSGWESEAGNVIAVDNTNRDINFHGGADLGNVVTVLNGVLSYDPSQNSGPDRGYWTIVGDHVTTHANIDPYAANVVKFAHAEGYAAADVIFGTDGGAYLDGKGGNDLLTGGTGDDRIIGGTGNDLLAGGTGRDTFVFAVGSGRDVIFDFDATTPSHDVIAFDHVVFADVAAILAAAAQVGDDVLIDSGVGDTVLIAGVSLSELQANVDLFAVI